MTADEYIDSRGHTVAAVHKCWAMVDQAAPACVRLWRRRRRARLARLAVRG